MNIGLKGTDHNSRTTRIYFERVPGAREPMVRIRTESGIIYVTEEDFSEMIVALFSEKQEAYQPRHGRKGENK